MKKTFLAFAAAALLASCTSTMPIAATSNPAGSKVGESSYVALFEIFPLNFGGEAKGIKEAAENGGIRRISTVDRTVRHFFVFSRVTTVVTGE